MENKIVFVAVNANDHGSCGHHHQTREAAEKCLPKMYKRPHAAGAVIMVRKFIDGVQAQG